MPVVVENALRKAAISKNLTGSRADAYVYGTMNKLGLLRNSGGQSSAVSQKQRIQPFISTGIPGIKKGKKVSLRALSSPL